MAACTRSLTSSISPERNPRGRAAAPARDEQQDATVLYVLVQAEMTNTYIWTAVRERSSQVYGVQRCSPSLALLHWPDNFNVSTLAVDDWVLRVRGRRCHLSFTLPKCAAGSEMDTDEWYPAGIKAVQRISKHEQQQPSSKASQVGPMISSKLSQVGFEVCGLIFWLLDAFRPRGATWSGRVISSSLVPSGAPSKTHLLPGGGVPRVHRARSPVPPRLPRFAPSRSVHLFAAVAAGAYPPRRPPNAWSPGAPAPPGPVLLACRQWDPVRLALRVPSLGVGAWRSAPLLPWLVQCLVRVCAALAAGSGGSGRYLLLCLSSFPLPAPRVPRCVWRAVLSGCPLPSLAGTSFHAVCAFRQLSLVALLVVPACPLRVCPLALPQRPLPPKPGWCGVRTSRGPGTGRW